MAVRLIFIKYALPEKRSFNPQRLQVIVVYPKEQAGLFSVLT